MRIQIQKEAEAIGVNLDKAIGPIPDWASEELVYHKWRAFRDSMDSSNYGVAPFKKKEKKKQKRSVQELKDDRMSTQEMHNDGIHTQAVRLMENYDLHSHNPFLYSEQADYRSIDTETSVVGDMVKSDDTVSLVNNLTTLTELWRKHSDTVSRSVDDIPKNQDKECGPPTGSQNDDQTIYEPALQRRRIPATGLRFAKRKRERSVYDIDPEIKKKGICPRAVVHKELPVIVDLRSSDKATITCTAAQTGNRKSIPHSTPSTRKLSNMIKKKLRKTLY